MATIIRAGKYIFVIDIPVGKYDLKAVKGHGEFKYRRGREWMWFGVEEDFDAREYRNLEGKEGQWFELTGSVEVEITKSKVLEIK